MSSGILISSTFGTLLSFKFLPAHRPSTFSLIVIRSFSVSHVLGEPSTSPRRLAQSSTLMRKPTQKHDDTKINCENSTRKKLQILIVEMSVPHRPSLTRHPNFPMGCACERLWDSHNLIYYTVQWASTPAQRFTCSVAGRRASLSSVCSCCFCAF